MKRRMTQMLAQVLTFMAATVVAALVVISRTGHVVTYDRGNVLLAVLWLYVGAGLAAGAVWFIGALWASLSCVGTPRSWGLVALLLNGLARLVSAYMPASSTQYILGETDASSIALGIVLSIVIYNALAAYLGAYVGVFLLGRRRVEDCCG